MATDTDALTLTVPEAMQVWGIGTVRNEADLIRVNVLHHLSEGIDRFLLLDNGSSDGTAAVLGELAKDYPVEWQRCDEPFHQEHLLTRLARTAFEHGADWIVPIDADEFWYAPGSSIRAVLASTAAAALEVEVVNLVQRRDQVAVSEDALLHMTRRVAVPRGPVGQIAALVESDGAAFVEIQYPPKWMCRASATTIIGWGNHSVDILHGVRRRTVAIVCLHAPLRAKALLDQKADAGRPTPEVVDYLAQAWHVRRWRRLASEGRLDREWEANSYERDTLDTIAGPRPVVEDQRLRDLVAPWLGKPESRATEGGNARFATQDLIAAASAVEGWFEPDELDLLARVATRALTAGPAAAILEIGSFCGRSTIVLAGVMRRLSAPGTVHAIDPHQGEVSTVQGGRRAQNAGATYERLVHNLRTHGLEDTVTVIRARSTDTEWSRPIGLLLVDGLHDKVSVQQDVAHFSGYVQRGGYLAFHDYSADYPGVVDCVQQLVQSHRFVVRDLCRSLIVLQHVGDARCDPTAFDSHPEIRRLEGERTGSALVRDHRLDQSEHERSADLSKSLNQTYRALAEAAAARDRASTRADALEAEVAAVRQSLSWRLTAPLRALLQLIRGY